MQIDQIIVIILGTLGMIFTYWFFFMKKEEVVKAMAEIDVIVSGGYKPSVIEIKNNKSTKINFLRKDPSGCLEEVVLSDFKIKKFLPLNKKISIDLYPKTKGEYEFSCGMNMYHGKLIVT